MRCRAQLHRLLQSRARKGFRPAINGDRYGEAQTAGVGDRPKTAKGLRPSGHLPQQGGDLLVSVGEGADDHGQHHLRRRALRRPLARQIALRAVLVVTPIMRGDWAEKSPSSVIARAFETRLGPSFFYGWTASCTSSSSAE